MSRGQRRTLATLSDIGSDTTPTAYSPATIWVAVFPSGPGADDERKRSHDVETDYNAQLTTNTKLTLDDGRVLFVKGIEDEDNRHVTHNLYCEEMLTP